MDNKLFLKKDNNNNDYGNNQWVYLDEKGPRSTK